MHTHTNTHTHTHTHRHTHSHTHTHTHKNTLTSTYHTDTKDDDFAWLRDLTRKAPRPLQYLYLENLETKAHLASLPHLATLKAQLTQLTLEACVREMEQQPLLPPLPVPPPPPAASYGRFTHTRTPAKVHLRVPIPASIYTNIPTSISANSSSSSREAGAADKKNQPPSLPPSTPTVILDEHNRAAGREGYHIHALQPSPDFSFFAFRCGCLVGSLRTLFEACSSTRVF